MPRRSPPVGRSAHRSPASATLVVPFCTLTPLAVVNAGQLSKTVPCAGCPFAYCTVSATVVVARPLTAPLWASIAADPSTMPAPTVSPNRRRPSPCPGSSPGRQHPTSARPATPAVRIHPCRHFCRTLSFTLKRISSQTSNASLFARRGAQPLVSTARPLPSPAQAEKAGSQGTRPTHTRHDSVSPAPPPRLPVTRSTPHRHTNEKREDPEGLPSPPHRSLARLPAPHAPSSRLFRITNHPYILCQLFSAANHHNPKHFHPNHRLLPLDNISPFPELLRLEPPNPLFRHTPFNPAMNPPKNRIYPLP